MTTITTPVGRLVSGSVHLAKEKDGQGNPLTIKTGPNAGQPRKDFYFGVAIPKQGEQIWWQTEWGAKIYQVGREAFPNLFQPDGTCTARDFAWKITDGDSQELNTNSIAPCTREGYPGNWVLHFSNGFPSKIWTADGSQEITQPDVVKKGYYIQVHADVTGNETASKPGIYLNHRMVAFSGIGQEIITGPSADSVGFGGALPAGATAPPVESYATPGQQAFVAPQAPAAAPAPAVAPQAPAAAPVPAVAPQAPAAAPAPAVAPQAPAAAPAPAPGAVQPNHNWSQ